MISSNQDDRPGKRSREPEQRPIIPLPAETLQDTEAMLSAQQRLNSWVDEAYEEFVRKGGLDHLPGKGKPLVVPTGDIFETILKQANVPPPWIMLRNDVKAALTEVRKLLLTNGAHPEIDVVLGEINEKIKELNRQAPSMTLHRKQVTRDNFEEQYARWL